MPEVSPGGTLSHFLSPSLLPPGWGYKRSGFPSNRLDSRWAPGLMDGDRAGLSGALGVGGSSQTKKLESLSGPQAAGQMAGLPADLLVTFSHTLLLLFSRNLNPPTFFLDDFCSQAGGGGVAQQALHSALVPKGRATRLGQESSGGWCLDCS